MVEQCVTLPQMKYFVEITQLKVVSFSDWVLTLKSSSKYFQYEYVVDTVDMFCFIAPVTS